MRRRSSAFCALVLLTVTLTAAPAFAGGGTTRGDRRIAITGDVVVAKGETVGGPVIAVDGNATIAGTVRDYVGVGNGNLRVSGRVTRGVVVVHGDAHISGRVGGDVVALSGRVIVSPGARVSGDVVSRLEPRVARGTVNGSVKRVDLQGIFTGLIIGFLAVLWISVTISMAILGLIFVGLFPRAADTAAAAGKRVGGSIGWGALVGIVGPLIAAFVLVTIVGIPLGLTAFSALSVLAPLGYVTTALLIGRVWVKGTTNGARIGAFFAGFGILRIAALLPAVGLLVWLGACIYGLGALSLAAWYGGRTRRDEGPPRAHWVAAEPGGPTTVEPAPDPVTEDFEPAPVAWSASDEPPP
jgi:hypothetical protein